MDLSQNLRSPVWVESLVCNVCSVSSPELNHAQFWTAGELWSKSQSLSILFPAETFWFQQIMFDSELLLPLFDFNWKRIGEMIIWAFWLWRVLECFFYILILFQELVMLLESLPWDTHTHTQSCVSSETCSRFRLLHVSDPSWTGGIYILCSFSVLVPTTSNSFTATTSKLLSAAS